MLREKSLSLYFFLMCCSAFLTLLVLFWGAFNVLAEHGDGDQSKPINQNADIDLTASPSSAFIGGSNLAPGDQIQSTIDIHNHGRLDFEYGVTARKQSGSDQLYDIFEVTVEDGNQVIYEGALQDLQQLNIGSLPSKGQDQLTFTFDLPLYAGNDYQGLTTIVAFDFIAHGEMDSTGDHVSDDKDRDISQPIVSPTDHTEPVNAGRLPNTSTYWYNLLFWGILLLVIGSYLLWRYSKKAGHSVNQQI